MKLIEVTDQTQMSVLACEMIVRQIMAKPHSILGLATGSTPEETYALLIQAYRQGRISFKGITTFNLDEYAGIATNALESYHVYMRERFFKHVDINQKNTYIPEPEPPFESSCQRYEALLKEHPIDLQLLGLGSNGHIGFNEPGVDFNLGVHLVDLADQTRQDNARHFKSFEDAPSQAITMGIRNILSAKKIVLLVNHAKKRDALSALLKGEKTPSWPVTALIDHPDLTIIAVKNALSDS